VFALHRSKTLSVATQVVLESRHKKRRRRGRRSA
jgi:hypothetical protein